MTELMVVARENFYAQFFTTGFVQVRSAEGLIVQAANIEEIKKARCCVTQSRLTEYDEFCSRLGAVMQRLLIRRHERKPQDGQ